MDGLRRKVEKNQEDKWTCLYKRETKFSYAAKV